MVDEGEDDEFPEYQEEEGQNGTPPPANPVHEEVETPRVDIDAVLDIVATPEMREEDIDKITEPEQAYSEVLDKNSEDGRINTP